MHYSTTKLLSIFIRNSLFRSFGSINHYSYNKPSISGTPVTLIFLMVAISSNSVSAATTPLQHVAVLKEPQGLDISTSAQTFVTSPFVSTSDNTSSFDPASLNASINDAPTTNILANNVLTTNVPINMPISLSIDGNGTTNINHAEFTDFDNTEDIDAIADIQELDSIDEEDIVDDIDMTESTFKPDSIDEDDTGDEIDATSNADEEVIDIANGYVPLNAISPKTLETFVEVVDIVRNDYVYPVNDEALFQNAIVGMLEKLDSHAEYLTPERYERLRGFTDGEIGQVGLTVQYNQADDVWIVTDIALHSSASASGIQIGDRLLKIRKITLDDTLRPQDIAQMLSGIAGSQITVTTAPPRGSAQQRVLQRDLATDTALKVTIEQGVAIVRLPVFQNSSKEQLIEALRAQQVPIKGVILDIRNNPGGVLSSAIDIASLFVVNKGLIQVRNRTNSSQILSPNGTPYLAGLPVVVLQNRYSASAAEVLASSLQTNNRATIMGETSYGKGTVQEVIPLRSGSAVKLSVAEYRSADGAIIDGVGVVPDVELPLGGSVDWLNIAVATLLAQPQRVELNITAQPVGIELADDY